MVVLLVGRSNVRSCNQINEHEQMHSRKILLCWCLWYYARDFVWVPVLRYEFNIYYDSRVPWFCHFSDSMYSTVWQKKTRNIIHIVVRQPRGNCDTSSISRAKKIPNRSTMTMTKFILRRLSVHIVAHHRTEIVGADPCTVLNSTFLTISPPESLYPISSAIFRLFYPSAPTPAQCLQFSSFHTDSPPDLPENA